MANGQDSIVVKADSVHVVYGQAAVLSGIVYNDRITFLWRWRGGFSIPPLLNETFVIYPNGKRIGRRFVYCIKKHF